MARCDGNGRIRDGFGWPWTIPCPGCPACLVKGEAPTVTRHYITRAGHVIPLAAKYPNVQQHERKEKRG